MLVNYYVKVSSSKCLLLIISQSLFCNAGSSCVPGSVKLTGGLIPTEGTVLMCVGGRWRKLCYSYWGYQEAFVVCRQLELPATGETAAPTALFHCLLVFHIMITINAGTSKLGMLLLKLYILFFIGYRCSW